MNELRGANYASESYIGTGTTRPDAVPPPPPCETCERHGDSYPPMPFFAPARPQVQFAFLPSEWHGDSYLHPPTLPPAHSAAHSATPPPPLRDL